MKAKNPLYVVKGKDVHEASGLFDLVIKKFNLEPVVQIIQNLLKMLLEQVKNWPSFIAVKNIVDELLAKYMGILKNFKFA